jgi:chromosome segregation ATPase
MDSNIETTHTLTTVPEHDKIFNEICNKLNELSQTEDTKSSRDKMVQLEKMQNQMKSFQLDLLSNHEDMKLKIDSLEKMTVSNSDLTLKVQEMTDLLNQERAHNSKLSTDLARSLDLSLKLQLEIQDIKSKALQAQMDDRKQYLENFENLQFDFQKQKTGLLEANDDLIEEIKIKENQIEELTQKMNSLEVSISEFQVSSDEQNHTIKHLMTVAETKIIELKLSLDRVSADLDNSQGQQKQNLTQIELLKQENYSLKDYINKMTAYQKQMTATQQTQPQK